MGAWGTAISSNDTYVDIYGEFFDLYNDGLDVSEISKRLMASNRETINDGDDSNNFWFALAKAQWQCKQLDPEVYQRVKTIIETEADLEVWRELNADEKDIKKRKMALHKFLFDISAERPKAKPRRKKKVVQPLFEKGNCLTFQFDNGNYGGAVVLEAIPDTELGLNLIAKTRINQPNKPTIKEFERSNVLVKSFASWKDKPDIGWCYATSFIRSKIAIEVIGKIDVDINYNPNDYSSNFYYGCSDEEMIKIPMLQFEFERASNKPLKTVTMKEMTRKHKFKFW